MSTAERGIDLLVDLYLLSGFVYKFLVFGALNFNKYFDKDNIQYLLIKDRFSISSSMGDILCFLFSLTNPQRGWLITPEGCAPKGQEAPKGAGRKRKRADTFGLNRD